jgi:hypothetical protein
MATIPQGEIGRWYLSPCKTWESSCTRVCQNPSIRSYRMDNGMTGDGHPAITSPRQFEIVRDAPRLRIGYRCSPKPWELYEPDFHSPSGYAIPAMPRLPCSGRTHKPAAFCAKCFARKHHASCVGVTSVEGVAFLAACSSNGVSSSEPTSKNLELQHGRFHFVRRAGFGYPSNDA